MILIEERKPCKVPGVTSFFISFNYNQNIINELSKLDCGKNFNKKTKEWEIPICNLGSIIDLLCSYDDISLRLLSEDIEKPLPVKIDENSFKTHPFPYQLEGIEYGVSHKKWLLLDEMGLGKAFSLDTPILTKEGFKPIKNLTLKDTLYDENGDECHIKAIYDHKDLEMFRITFSDGTQIDCCKDHLWQLYYNKTNKQNKPELTYTVKNTQWLYERSKSKYFGKWGEGLVAYLPLCQPIKFPKKDLPINPYILGCLLGDGHIRKDNVSLTTLDEFIYNKFNDLLPEELTLNKPFHPLEKNIDSSNYSGYYIIFKPEYRKTGRKIKGETFKFSRNPILESLNNLNLAGHLSYTKFIPNAYKYSSVEDRIALIQGLMDTDGYAGKDNLLQYTTTSKQLSEDVRFIIESLGGLVSLREDMGSYKLPNGEIKKTVINYTLTIKIQNPQSLVSIPRKKERLHSKSNHLPRRIFKKIERIPNAPGRCLTVDSPNHLFIAKNFIVTHNTLQAIYIAESLYNQNKLKHCLIICGVNSLKSNWKKEITKHSKLDSIILGERVLRNGKLNTDPSSQERINHLMSPIKEFFIITNIESLRNDKFIEALEKGPNQIDMIIVDELHKCLPYESIIETDKGPLEIGYIVENQLKCKAKSYNYKDKTIEYKDISNFYFNGYRNDIIELTIEDENGITHKLKCSKNHNIYTQNRGYIKADELKEEDILEIDY